MRYRLTCLTPLLVGDGHRLSPIDYMVWKDQVNVLDQRRIFKLLSKGPRLEGYLQQLKKAEKLDFASWGGFAQNFADRRIPFEHPSAAAYWERAQGESLHIPTFVSGPGGPFLPGSALKGALRTGMLFARWKDGGPRDLERLQGDRLPRRPGEPAEEHALGGGTGTSFMKAVSVADSAPVGTSVLRLYMLRVSTLQARGQGRYEVGWKQAPRNTVARAEDGTPIFAEMAAPGTAFEGEWKENGFYSQPDVQRALRWRAPVNTARVFESANDYAARLLQIQKQYAASAGLPAVQQAVEALESQLAAARGAGNACMIAIGWGGGILTKSAWLDTETQEYRAALKAVPLYTKALQTGLPFPKTRRIVFLGNQPATLPGMALLTVE